jgi:hypothetical protein
MSQINTLTSLIGFYRCGLQIILLIIIVSMLIPTSTCSIEQPGDNSKEVHVKAAYIYNFTKFVYWGSQECDEAVNPLIITIFGADPIFNLLQEYVRNQKKGRSVKVQKVESEKLDAQHCQLFFISHSETKQLSALLKQFEGAKILTVSDISGFVHKGGMIGFFIEEGRVKIEVNLNIIKKAGLKISAKLLEVARIVTNED